MIRHPITLTEAVLVHVVNFEHAFVSWGVFKKHENKRRKHSAQFLQSLLDGSPAMVGFVGLVPSCHRAFVGFSWVQNFFSWVFRGNKFFLVGISRVRNFFSWVFYWSKFFSRGHFVGRKFFLVGFLSVRNFFLCVFYGSNFFFLWLISSFKDFQLLAAWARVAKTEIQTKYSFLNRFQQLSVVSFISEKWFFH